MRQASRAGGRWTPHPGPAGPRGAQVNHSRGPSEASPTPDRPGWGPVVTRRPCPCPPGWTLRSSGRHGDSDGHTRGDRGRWPAGQSSGLRQARGTRLSLAGKSGEPHPRPSEHHDDRAGPGFPEIDQTLEGPWEPREELSPCSLRTGSYSSPSWWQDLPAEDEDREPHGGVGAKSVVSGQAHAPHACTRLSVYMHTHTHVCKCPHDIHRHTLTQANVCTYLSSQTCMDVCTCMCTMFTRVCTHCNVYTHIQTATCPSSLQQDPRCES